MSNSSAYKLLLGSLVVPEDSIEYLRVRLVIIFTFIGVLTLISFGLLNVTNTKILVGSIEVGAAALLVVNLLLLRFTKNINLAGFNMIILIGIPMVYLLYDGGIGGTGIYWSLAFPVVSFLLLGRKLGLVTTALLVLATVGASLIGELYYSGVEIRQALLSIVVISTLMFVYENSNSSLRDSAQAGKEELYKANQKMQEAILIRDKLAEKSQQQNEELERMNSLMVGREVKMVELKDEIKELTVKSNHV